uniref:Uncharacterized protein n=1 Tax=Plectus sambesii TaxID=2011161 RepID=A0A914X9E7_9BILA
MTTTVVPLEYAPNGASARKTKMEPKKSIARFFKKYLFEGQRFHDEGNEDGPKVVIPEDADWMERFALNHRKLLGFCLPLMFMWTWWWIYAIKHNILALYPYRYAMPVTMAFGSFIGGMTCEGGGAIAFPVMTLILQINPTIARDFALMIQSCGMTAAAATILYMGVALEWHSIVFCSLGAAFGIVIGIEFVDPYMSKAQKKMFFVSIWFSFACALFLLNTQKKRKTYLRIQMFNWWKAIVLVVTGFAGGVLTSFSGSGVCVCSFSILTLLFSINEKIATQTSIILIANNVLVGFFWRAKINETISQLAWEYWLCAAPVAALTGPMGSFLGSFVHRQTLACAVYLLETVAIIGGFIIVKPGIGLTIACAAIVIGGFGFFYCLSKIGIALLRTYPDEKQKNIAGLNAEAIQA